MKKESYESLTRRSMTTLEKIENSDTIPTLTAMCLANISESRGKQDLFTSQSPQKLKVLREHALIQSAVSSSRIEGVEIENARVKPVILGKPTLKNRNEEEVYGYRQALNWIHSDYENIPISEKTIKKFHKLVKGDIWDAGKFREKPGDIIETYPDGRSRIRFQTLEHQKINQAITDLVQSVKSETEILPALISIIAFNLDFLCIHPFRDGNGRVSRLLILLQCYQAGFEVGRYISIERLIEDHKERYYETLESSSVGWHEGKHNPWHYINFMLFILKQAYKEFEEREGELKMPRGAKTEIVIRTIEKIDGDFTLRELESNCPGVSRDMIRKILQDLKKKGVVECIGIGPGAKWRKEGNNS